jgi:hypothetical protein
MVEDVLLSPSSEKTISMLVQSQGGGFGEDKEVRNCLVTIQTHKLTSKNMGSKERFPPIMYYLESIPRLLWGWHGVTGVGSWGRSGQHVEWPGSVDIHPRSSKIFDEAYDKTLLQNFVEKDFELPSKILCLGCRRRTRKLVRPRRFPATGRSAWFAIGPLY